MIIKTIKIHTSITISILILLAIFPLLVIAFSVPEYLWAFFIGGTSWTVALGAKMLVGFLPIMRKLMLAGPVGAAIWGLISGTCELGVFGIAFVVTMLPLNPISGLACGLGAACFEIAYLVVAGAIEDYRHPNPEKFKRWLAGAKVSNWIAHMAVIERIGASLLHILTRVLVVVSFLTLNPGPALIALAAFIVVDGLATFGVAEDWDWFNATICRRFYTSVYSVVSLCLLALAIVTYFELC